MTYTPTTWVDNSTPAINATNLNKIESGISSAHSLLSSTGLNVKDYGAVGDGTTNDTTALQSALTAGAGKTVVIPDGTYKITSALNIPANTKVVGTGTIKQATSGQSGLTVGGSNVFIDGLTITGPRTVAAYTAGEYGIYLSAPNIAGAYKNISINNCTISMWGYAGIQMQFVDGFEVLSCVVTTVGYNGIAILSGANGLIQANRVQGVGPGSSGNMYGISLSFGGSEGASNPSTRDTVVDGNVVQDVNWEGIETHGGLRITFSNNQVLHCKTGIAFAQGTTSSITGGIVTGNLVDYQTDLDTSGTNYAMQVYGLDSSNPATGVVITNNTFKRHTYLALNTVTGAIVSNNTFDRIRQMGIWIESEVRKAIIVGNQFIDMWDSSGGWNYAIRSSSSGTNSSATIIGNSVSRGAMTAGTNVINDSGFYFDATPAGISYKVFGNDLTAVTNSQVSGTTDVIRSGAALMVSGNVGFYGTTPIAKPTVSGSRGSNAALTSLCTALANLGLITNSTS